MRSLPFLIALTTLSATAAFADAPARRTIQLREDAVIGGIKVRAGNVDIFQPGDELAAGVLAEPAVLTGLDLPAGTAVDLTEPGRVHTAKLPAEAPVVTVGGVPFRGGATLTATYTDYLVRLHGRVARNPDQLPGFPTGGLSHDAFINDVSALCLSPIDHPEKHYSCNFSVLLSSPVDQPLGPKSVRIPGGATVTFAQYGLETIQLAHDDVVLGLPVSANAPIRLNRYSQGGPVEIMSLLLADEAEYQGEPLASGTEIELYNSDANGVQALRSFVPPRDVAMAGGNQKVIVAEGSVAQVNRDGSLRYGILGENQVVHSILFPKGAILFLGDQLDSTISSVGLRPFTKIVVDGVTYGDSIGGQLFVDFDAHEKVIRVR